MPEFWLHSLVCPASPALFTPSPDNFRTFSETFCRILRPHLKGKEIGDFSPLCRYYLAVAPDVRIGFFLDQCLSVLLKFLLRHALFAGIERIAALPAEIAAVQLQHVKANENETDRYCLRCFESTAQEGMKGFQFSKVVDGERKGALTWESVGRTVRAPLTVLRRKPRQLPRLFFSGAGYGNRTRLLGLGSRCTTDVLTLQSEAIIADFPAQCKAKFAKREDILHGQAGGGIG